MIDFVKLNRSRAALAVSTLLIAGCGGGGSNGIPPISSVNPVSTGKLQFAVGTANLYGSATGLNVVSTFRQSNGLSNVTVDTPTITGPFTLPAAFPLPTDPASPQLVGYDPYSTILGGPSVEEVAAGHITGTSQTVHPGTPACDQTTPCTVPSSNGSTVSVAPNTSTFGQAGGVFTNGIAPGNYTANAVPSSFVPYAEPLYDATSGNQFEAFGGPPAFAGGHGLGLRDGLSNIGDGVLGIPEGVTTFDGVGVASGTYNLSVEVPTGFSGSTPTFATVTAPATLTSTATLGTIVAPDLTLDGNGGASFTVASFPSGVTEELVQITEFGNSTTDTTYTNCQGAAGSNALPVYYTILVKSPGTYSLPDTIGPNTTITSGASTITPSPSICTVAQNAAAAAAVNAAAAGSTPANPPGDNYTVQAIGADYPLYEALYPNNTSQSPTLVGSNGQADITISAVSGPAASLSRARRTASRLRRI